MSIMKSVLFVSALSLVSFAGQATTFKASPSQKVSLQDQLNALMVAAPQKGKRSDFQHAVNYYYTNIKAQNGKQRSVDYLSVIGIEDVNQNFYPQMLSTVSEVWNPNGVGGFDVVQKIREVTMDGRIYSSLDQMLVFDARGTILQTVPGPVISKEQDAADFAAEIQNWYSLLKGE